MHIQCETNSYILLISLLSIDINKIVSSIIKLNNFFKYYKAFLWMWNYVRIMYIFLDNGQGYNNSAEVPSRSDSEDTRTRRCSTNGKLCK